MRLKDVYKKYHKAYPCIEIIVDHYLPEVEPGGYRENYPILYSLDSSYLDINDNGNINIPEEKMRLLRTRSDIYDVIHLMDQNLERHTPPFTPNFDAEGNALDYSGRKCLTIFVHMQDNE